MTSAYSDRILSNEYEASIIYLFVTGSSLIAKDNKVQELELP